MTISALDDRTALLVVDLQKGIVGLPTAHKMTDVVANAAKLADDFRRRGLPVVLINVDAAPSGRTEQARPTGAFPAGWTDLVPELRQQASDHLVTKRSWGAFTGTGLEQHLKQNGVTQVVIAGVATSAGVESTARHAHELGFNVALVTDAMTDRSLDAHDRSIKLIFPRLGETGTSQEIAGLLEGRPGGLPIECKGR
jgi:nicotinamidase-related amidase